VPGDVGSGRDDSHVHVAVVVVRSACPGDLPCGHHHAKRTGLRRHGNCPGPCSHKLCRGIMAIMYRVILKSCCWRVTRLCALAYHVAFAREGPASCAFGDAARMPGVPGPRPLRSTGSLSRGLQDTGSCRSGLCPAGFTFASSSMNVQTRCNCVENTKTAWNPASGHPEAAVKGLSDCLGCGHTSFDHA